MAPVPGILYVTMAPKPTLSDAQFHEWYNNEHGPTRIRLPFITNGFRYRASDLAGPGKGMPEWMAMYDVTDMAEMTKEPYLRLRDPPVKSAREQATMAQIAVDRRLYDLVDSQQVADYQNLEDVGADLGGNVIVAVFLTIREGGEKDLEAWYKEEHVPMLSKVPGWLRTRLFKTSPIDPKAIQEYMALHEYAPKNGLGGAEFQAATSTKWQKQIMDEVVTEKRRRVYDLYLTFGAAPRELAALESKDTSAFISPDGKTKTYPASVTGGTSGAIESYITTPDGVELPYCLEGSSDPEAPLIVLSNSILVDWHIWDDFIASFFSVPANRKYRILRYLTRGRTSTCGSQPITVDVLGNDIIALLDTLRVPQAAAIIGVSLGGATTLNVALKHPTRVAAFISCDTSAKSPAGNSKAWGERIALAEKEGAIASAATIAVQTGEAIVGNELAEITTRRWFVKESYEGPAELVAKLAAVKEMVANNSLEGFKKSVNALFEYDMTPLLKGSKVKGAFVVGGSDGVLPESMKKLAESYGEAGALFGVVQGAGHLPMVEKPEEFAKIVGQVLG